MQTVSVSCFYDWLTKVIVKCAFKIKHALPFSKPPLSFKRDLTDRIKHR